MVLAIVAGGGDCFTTAISSPIDVWTALAFECFIINQRLSFS